MSEGGGAQEGTSWSSEGWPYLPYPLPWRLGELLLRSSEVCGLMSRPLPCKARDGD